MSMVLSTKFKIALCALVLGVAINTPAMAVDINYTDADHAELQPTPEWVDNDTNHSLFPGTATEPLASDNTVTVNYTTDLPIPDYVLGGLSNSGDVNNNKVEIAGGWVNWEVFGAYLENVTGNANENTVTITGGKVYGDAYGAYLYNVTGDANNNTVTISGGKVGYYGDWEDGFVYGAYLHNVTGNASENKVEISGGQIYSYASGADLIHVIGNANNNTVTITGGQIDSYAGGAYLYDTTGNASENTVTISGGEVGWRDDDGDTYGGDVCGAYLDNVTGNASGNKVEISGGEVYNDAFGAYLYNVTGNASGNKVEISGGQAYGDVYGAYLTNGTNGNASNNTVTISGGEVGWHDDEGKITNGEVFAAYLNSGVTGDATNNTVNISGEGSFSSVSAAAFMEDVTGNANYNTVNIFGKSIVDAAYCAALNPDVNGNANYNTVNIYDNATVYVTAGAINGSQSANNNTVNIYDNAKVLTAHGAIINDSQSAANNNTVNIYGNVTLGKAILDDMDNLPQEANMVCGAWIEFNGANGDTVNIYGKANNNTVNISGNARVTNMVYGAYLYVRHPDIGPEISGSDTADDDVTDIKSEMQNNIVHIWGAPDLSVAQLYGTNLASWATDGNTLFVDDYRGAEVNAVGHFQNYRFNIGDNVTDTDAALVVTNTVNLTGANAKIIGLAKNAPLTAGDELMLIDNTNKGELTSYSSTLAKGFARIYHFEYYYKDFTPQEPIIIGWEDEIEPLDENDGPHAHLMARIAGADANPTTKSLSEGFLAGAVFLNQKNELMSKWGLPAMGQALKKHPNSRVVPFAIIQGGGSVYKTGSSINVKGFSGLAGLAFEATENLSMGAFFEGGWGNYNTRNSFNNFPNVKGDGGTRYYGGGVMARKNNIWRGLYAQGYFSIGRSEVDFRTNDLFNDVGQRAEYDASSTYYSAHAGLGYLLDLSENAEADIYARYLWNRMGRDKVTVGYEPVRFKAVDSHRLQLGVRAHYDLVPGFIPYAGAAWEYEFGGKAKASIDGMNIDAPSVRGATGIGELGFTLRPDLDAPFYIEAGVQGYVGKREGVTGTLRLSLAF